jgi:hypothetical protein
MQTEGFRSMPKFLSCSAAAVISVFAVAHANADIRIYAAAGLSQQTPEAGSQPSTKALTGAVTKLAGHLDVFSPVPGVSIYAGPEIQMGTFIREYDDAAALKAKETVKMNSAGLEAGVHVGLIPIVTLQAGLNYGFPTGGTKEVVKPTGTVSGKATKGSETGLTLRALITPFPLFRLGAEYSVGTGAVTHENHGELKYSLWAARGVLGIAL